MNSDDFCKLFVCLLCVKCFAVFCWAILKNMKNSLCDALSDKSELQHCMVSQDASIWFVLRVVLCIFYLYYVCARASIFVVHSFFFLLFLSTCLVMIFWTNLEFIVFSNEFQWFQWLYGLRLQGKPLEFIMFLGKASLSLLHFRHEFKWFQ